MEYNTSYLISHFERHGSVKRFGLELVSPELMIRYDVFHSILGYESRINGPEGALIRWDGTTSFHNAKEHGVCMALDCRPERIDPYAWYEAAGKAGFRGFGLYVGRNRLPFIHLDVRPKRFVKAKRSMAIWGAIVDAEGINKYTTLHRAFAFFNKQKLKK